MTNKPQTHSVAKHTE